MSQKSIRDCSEFPVREGDGTFAGEGVPVSNPWGGGVLDTTFDRGDRLEDLNPDPVPQSFAPENGTHV